MSEPLAQSSFDRFVASMDIGYEQWHDGIGYDLGALAECSADERAAIEQLLVPRRNTDWRDVEALAALRTPASVDALCQAMASGSVEIRNAVMSHAPDLVPDEDRTRSLIDALEHAVIYGGLTQTLLQVESYHPPEVIDAVLRGAAHREGEVAVHLAAMALFLHGRAESSFDMEQRPFFLRFAGPDGHERATVFAELCQMIGVDATTYR